MTIRIEFNGVPLTCEYEDTFVKSAWAGKVDIMPILSASTGIHGEVIRLVKEAHRKEYAEELKNNP